MLFTTVLLALAAATPVFSAPVPSIELTRRHESVVEAHHDTFSPGAPHHKAAKRQDVGEIEEVSTSPDPSRPQVIGSGGPTGGFDAEVLGSPSGGIGLDDEEGSSTITDLLPRL